MSLPCRFCGGACGDSPNRCCKFCRELILEILIDQMKIIIKQEDDKCLQN